MGLAIALGLLMRLISTLFKAISRPLPKLSNKFSTTIVSTFFVPLGTVIPVVFFCLIINKALILLAALKLAIVSESLKVGSTL